MAVVDLDFFKFQGSGRAVRFCGIGGGGGLIDIIIGRTLFVYLDIDQGFGEEDFIDIDRFIKNQAFEVDPERKFFGRYQGILGKGSRTLQADVVQRQGQGGKMIEKRKSCLCKIQPAFDGLVCPLLDFIAHEIGKQIRDYKQGGQHHGNADEQDLADFQEPGKNRFFGSRHAQN